MVVVLESCVKRQVGAEVGEGKSFGVGAPKSAGICGGPADKASAADLRGFPSGCLLSRAN